MMQQIKEAAMVLSVTLIITGILRKIAPSKSNNSIINFITTLTLIVTIFSLDIPDISVLAESNYSNADITYIQEEHRENLEEKIYSAAKKSVADDVESIVHRYLPSSVVKTDLNEVNLTVSIECENYTDENKNAIETEIRKKYEGEIIIEFRRWND